MKLRLIKPLHDISAGPDYHTGQLGREFGTIAIGGQRLDKMIWKYKS